MRKIIAIIAGIATLVGCDIGKYENSRVMFEFEHGGETYRLMQVVRENRFEEGGYQTNFELFSSLQSVETNVPIYRCTGKSIEDCKSDINKFLTTGPFETGGEDEM